MTGQDSVLEAAALEREAHVRATIIESKDTPAVVDDKNRTMATVHNEPPLCLQLLQAPCEREILIRRVHECRSSDRVRAPDTTVFMQIIPPSRISRLAATPSVLTLADI